MERQQYQIECGRCGETRLEFLTEQEARVVSDAIGPAYRQCERCGKVTGWIEARSQCAGAEETRVEAAYQPSANAQTAERPVPRGQERVATQCEREQVKAMLQRSDGL
jgi:hypothetical protein